MSGENPLSQAGIDAGKKFIATPPINPVVTDPAGLSPSGGW